MKPQRTTAKKLPSQEGLKTRRSRIYMILLTVAVVLLSGLYLRYAWNRYQDIAASEAIMLAQSLEAMQHPEHIAALSGGEEDLENPEYAMLKISLIRLVRTANPIRFAYILGMRDGQMIFLADSEPLESDDYSPPGQVYYEAQDADFEPFNTGKTVLTEPATDRWGTWISVLVPITDPDNGKTFAVFGIDYSASEWHSNLWKRMIPDGAVVLSLLILFFALVHIWAEHMALKERSRKLSLDEALFHGVFDQAPVGIAILNDKSFVSQSEYGGMNINPMFEHILGRSSNSLGMVKWPEITHPDDLQADLEQFSRFKKGETNGYSMEKRFLRLDGSSVWTNMTISRLEGSVGTNPVHLCLLEDISVRKQMEEALKESERSKTVLLSHIPGMAYRCRYDRDWTMEFVSEGCQALTGYAPENLIGNRDLSYNDMISPEYRGLLYSEWIQVLDRRDHFRYEYEIMTRSGERKWVLELAQGIFSGDGSVEALEGIVIDISAQKMREAQISHLSEHDFLTGLYNRKHLENEKKRLDSEANWPLSIAVCDINGVRMINDSFGHNTGDDLIVNVARLLSNCCRDGDVLSRTGGDEFMLLMPRTDDYAVRQWVQHVQREIEAYNRTGKQNLYEVSLSIGYSTKESGEQNIDLVAKTAEDYLLHRKLLNQKSSHNAILSSIMATLYAKSHETEEHGKRLTRFTNMIGVRLGLDQKALDDLELLSMLHDIGKVGVDDRILNKPGKLTADEWEKMKKHSEIGYRIAMSTPELEPIADLILHHHEHWDGTGYPAGQKGTEIPLPSRILALADAYDAITEDRSYRAASPRETAIEEIKSCSGTQFDPDIARLFTDMMQAQ